MLYLINLGLNESELRLIENNATKETIDMLYLFPKIVEENYQTLKNTRINNYKEALISYPHMFLKNPDKFSAIFSKYDPDDLIRCLHQNLAIIEKL